MTQYAHVSNGVVVEVFSPPGTHTIADCFEPGLAAQFVPIPAGAVALPGFTAAVSGGVWTFTAPVPVVPTLAQQAQAAIGAGLAITSTGTPALSATYPVDAASQDHMVAEMTALLAVGTFADGTASVVWPDITGAPHTFNAAEFKALALAAGAYVAALFKVINGTLTALPAASATIP